MVLDPASGKPARIGYEVKADGTKERIFKVSANHEKNAKKAEKVSKTAKADKADKVEKPAKAEKPDAKAGKK
jgi:hypothetical protein